MAHCSYALDVRHLPENRSSPVLVISSIRTGVAKLICDEPTTVFTYCYGHSLNLAVGDTVKQNKVFP